MCVINTNIYECFKTGIIKWPAAAVIPAPIAYVKVAAVKKLVVEDGLLRFQYNIIFFFYFFYIYYKKIKKIYR